MNVLTKFARVPAVVAVLLMMAAGVGVADRAAAAPGSGAIQPRDGVWTGTLLDHEMTGCPAVLASRVEAMAPKMMAKENAKRLQFDKPFHPRSLLENSEQVHWTQIAPNRWRGLMQPTGGARSGMSAKVTMDLQVVSATRMRIKTAFTMDMPAQLSAMLGGGSGPCRFASEGRLDWSGK